MARVAPSCTASGRPGARRLAEQPARLVQFQRYFVGRTSRVFSVGSGDGGEIYVESGTAVSISRGVVLAIDMANYAGALCNSSGSFKISGVTIAGNNAVNGDAMINFGALTIVDSDIAGNVANPLADPFAIGSFETFGARGTTGGAIFNEGFLSVAGGVMANNKAGYGGAVENSKGSARFSGVSISSNTALERGGGIYSLNGSLTITNSAQLVDIGCCGVVSPPTSFASGRVRSSSICHGSMLNGRPDNSTARSCGGASKPKASAAAFGSWPSGSHAAAARSRSTAMP